MDNPRLWNGTADPFMYDVIVRLMDDSLLCDEVTVPLGLRYFSVDPKQGFLLNGSPYRLRGVSHYEDRASVGNALTPYQIAEDLDLIAEMCANAVRAAAYPHNESFYDECDRRGLVVLSELPLIGPAYMTDRGYINTEAFRDNGRDQLREMIFQQFNHPSVAVWGIFFDQTPRGDDPTAYVKELNSLAMLEDPSRLTSATSNQDGKINFVTDLVVWDHNYGWKEGLPSDIKVWLDQLRTNWGSLCSGISYGAGASIYHQDDSLYRPDYLGNWHPERWQTYLHEQYYPYIDGSPFLWGWFVANMFDYGAAGRNWGEGTASTTGGWSPSTASTARTPSTSTRPTGTVPSRWYGSPRNAGTAAPGRRRPCVSTRTPIRSSCGSTAPRWARRPARTARSYGKASRCGAEPTGCQARTNARRGRSDRLHPVAAVRPKK